jgi:hypothetical protein
VAHLYFFSTHRPTLTNTKELSNQRTKDTGTKGKQTTTERKLAFNTCLAKVAVQSAPQKQLWLIKHSSPHQYFW